MLAYVGDILLTFVHSRPTVLQQTPLLPSPGHYRNYRMGGGHEAAYWISNQAPAVNPFASSSYSPCFSSLMLSKNIQLSFHIKVDPHFLLPRKSDSLLDHPPFQWLDMALQAISSSGSRGFPANLNFRDVDWGSCSVVAPICHSRVRNELDYASLSQMTCSFIFFSNGWERSLHLMFRGQSQWSTPVAEQPAGIFTVLFYKRCSELLSRLPPAGICTRNSMSNSGQSHRRDQFPDLFYCSNHPQNRKPIAKAAGNIVVQCKRNVKYQVAASRFLRCQSSAAVKYPQIMRSFPPSCISLHEFVLFFFFS